MKCNPRSIPANAFACEFEAAEHLVDVQGRISNDRIVYLLSKAANLHSDAMGWTLDRYRAAGCWWVVRRHEVDYVAPANLGDVLVCRTWPSKLTAARALRRHVLYRRDDREVVAVGLNTWALVDIESARPIRIPPEIAKSFDPANFPLP